jgi:hypothetical protein
MYPSRWMPGTGGECRIGLDAVVSSGTRETPAADEQREHRSGECGLPQPPT